VDAFTTSALVAQAIVLFPLGVRYMLSNDPGLTSQPSHIRSKRLRIVPIFLALVLVIVALATGRLREIAFLWVLFFMLGWRMRRHPSEASRLASGGRPSLGTIGFVLGMVAVVTAAIALGSATG
jgi:hypothetical protein